MVVVVTLQLPAGTRDNYGDHIFSNCSFEKINKKSKKIQLLRRKLNWKSQLKQHFS
ncbi:hypothetical protein HanRHA438_Chr07g0301781 [Helianthus annuus]|nr:hypothetical protein HanIR_Chr07g0314281 [Helianthus annuus]KAJ0907668.1 hypothetical protein HanRHA438_Chr07g0301781 [Helianthus annuus]